MTPLTFIALLALGVGIGLCLGAFIGALALRTRSPLPRGEGQGEGQTGSAVEPPICPHCGKRHHRNVPSVPSVL